MKSKFFFTIPAFFLLALLPIVGEAFCGFYVSQADVTLSNKTSQVIVVRNGNVNTITMASDFEGDVKDFAMVIPVPVVLKRDDIKVVESSLFSKFNTYSAPRLVNYYDQQPCPQQYSYPSAAHGNEDISTVATLRKNKSSAKDDDYHVKVIATYNVEEYEIKILSADESSGLEKWLTDNGYKIPKGAGEVLEPYINNNMKFFVVKVDLSKAPAGMVTKQLRPLQIRFESGKFGLPIRLGMANSSGTQDMLVYIVTENGRVETTNYRTVQIPTDFNIPYIIQKKGIFAQFYNELFDQQYRTERKNVTFLEYGWNISGNVPVKCDPCNGPPPVYYDLTLAGVDWLKSDQNGFSGNAYFTRLHVRYDRANFPQDLMFQVTPNKQNFQGRYVVFIPAQGPFDCAEGQEYIKSLRKRRADEVSNVITYSGGMTGDYMAYISEYDQYYKGSGTSPDDLDFDTDGFDFPEWEDGFFSQKGAIFFLAGFGLLALIFSRRSCRWPKPNGNG